MELIVKLEPIMIDTETARTKSPGGFCAGDRFLRTFLV